ncbi:DUF262 domain-containing protein [Lysinibacillus sp. NPDC098008]|uniref:DUF262 domain-containing protein n=1 Tax=Lysinibacillus sp. NPDC098008 TaxID=3364146 RepID=UPI00382ECCD3
MNTQPEILQVSNLFFQANYEIPIYQRNYAWREEQIQQLLDDINTSSHNYFLGTLIVNQKDLDSYEVIDGQQRLTTLFLLQKYLKMSVLQGSLYFEAREKSNHTLAMLGKNNLPEELLSQEIMQGYKIIETYFYNKEIDKSKFIERLDNVQLIRIQVPSKIDLNHYFEIMNTRGEQLEFHEIAKAKLLSPLSSIEDKKVGALIWEACSKMDTYVQMNFNIHIRKKIFSSDWNKLRSSVRDFNEVKEKITNIQQNEEDTAPKTLLDILKERKKVKIETRADIEENERFESIISFPNFILQVNKTLSQSNENESLLDDKNFLRNIQHHWESEESCKNFLFNLLKCRVLFDQYILKREFAKDYKEIGKWSLQRIEAYEDRKKGNLKPKYVGTYDDGSDINDNKTLRTLQSCLRITYTSPKTMHWISIVLKCLMENEDVNVLSILEDYCKEKVKQSKFLEAKGFAIERIVFTYLDYILYRDGYRYNQMLVISPMKDNWQFQFRNSIEHFYPQNPSNSELLNKWADEDLNSFGNLALITVSGNSKFSNLPPNGKVSSYPSIIEQSLKLLIMNALINYNGGVWNESIADNHKEEMFALLKAECSL